MSIRRRMLCQYQEKCRPSLPGRRVFCGRRGPQPRNRASIFSLSQFFYCSSKPSLSPLKDENCPAMERNFISVFLSFSQIFRMGISQSSGTGPSLSSSKILRRPPATSLSDSTELRVILSILYTMTVVLRRLDDDDPLRIQFVNELSEQLLCGLYSRLPIGATKLKKNGPARATFSRIKNKT